MSECAVEECTKTAEKRGLCNAHYQSLRAYGSPTAIDERRAGSVTRRFWAKVNKDGPIPEHRPKLGSCWEWTASTYTRGYGMFSVAAGKPRGAHRVSWELAFGPIPDHHNVCHACDNPICVRPSHLFLGTQLDNLRDMYDKGRHPRPSPSHCPQGHEYTLENTRRDPGDGHLRCRACQKKRARAGRKRAI